MARTFAYCRVSTGGQTTENQIREIEGAGGNAPGPSDDDQFEAGFKTG